MEDMCCLDFFKIVFKKLVNYWTRPHIRQKTIIKPLGLHLN